MKSILILLSVIVAFVAYAEAGVGVTTLEIEAEAYRLWNKFCDGQSDGGNDEGLTVYCKRPRGIKKQSLTHNIELPRGEEAGQQVVFVQPQSYHYKHDVIVSGGGVAARKTVIYVKPAHHSHTVNVQDRTTPGEAAQKPTLYFLKGNHGGSDSTADIGAVPVTPPDNTYLPPTYLPPTQKPGYTYDAPEKQLNY